MKIYKVRRKSDGKFLITGMFPRWAERANKGKMYYMRTYALRAANSMLNSFYGRDCVNAANVEIVEYELVERGVSSIEA